MVAFVVSINLYFPRIGLWYVLFLNLYKGPLWSWSYGSWIYNYLCNQCLSPLMLWVRISIRARCTTLCDKVYQWLATGQWFSLGTSVSSTNKTDHHDITEILLKVMLNIINYPNLIFSTDRTVWYVLFFKLKLLNMIYN